MVITRLICGLGNQMFQYAAGRRLAHVLGVELKLDITGFERHTLRSYQLGNFHIRENFGSLKEITALTKRPILERVLNRMLGTPRQSAPTHIREKHFHFDPDILNLADGVYLEGHWQSEKYFSDIAGIIRQEFVTKTPVNGKNAEMAKHIASCNSVSLHIRRGDYVTNEKTNQSHGALGLDYYYRCIEWLAQRVDEPHFFIFSDDLKWALENLRLKYPTILVDQNDNQPHEDLRLMNRCAHHIIANSSFSWWGAWLNPNEQKIVIAPKQWFGSKKQATRIIDDLLPPSWITL